MPKNTTKSHITPTTATQFQAVADGGVYGKVLGSSIVTLVTDTVPIVTGTWTPTFSSLSGLSGTPTLIRAVYERIESRVRVSLAFSATLSGAGPTRYVSSTLPVARSGNFSADTEGRGVVTGLDGTTGLGGHWFAQSGAQTIRLHLYTATAVGTLYFFSEGTYDL